MTPVSCRSRRGSRRLFCPAACECSVVCGVYSALVPPSAVASVVFPVKVVCIIEGRERGSGRPGLLPPPPPPLPHAHGSPPWRPLPPPLSPTLAQEQVRAPQARIESRTILHICCASRSRPDVQKKMCAVREQRCPRSFLAPLFSSHLPCVCGRVASPNESKTVRLGCSSFDTSMPTPPSPPSSFK